ncbi:MAG: hypothetical protein QXH67_04890, partial [Candidatus Bathyarchaeia archaeon]
MGLRTFTVHVTSASKTTKFDRSPSAGLRGLLEKGVSKFWTEVLAIAPRGDPTVILTLYYPLSERPPEFGVLLSQ